MKCRLHCVLKLLSGAGATDTLSFMQTVIMPSFTACRKGLKALTCDSIGLILMEMTKASGRCASEVICLS